MTLLLTIFLLVLATEVISWIGKSVLSDAAYAVYLRLFNPSMALRQRQLKTEILAKKADLMKTSAQDEFAKWAKLRRSVDKGMADLEALNKEVASTKAAFALKFNTALWISTTGVQFFVGWYNRKAAVFYLPKGWFNYGPFEWALALPFAPKGSVSVGVWQMACRRVIKVGERVFKDICAPASLEEPTPVPQKEGKSL